MPDLRGTMVRPCPSQMARIIFFKARILAGMIKAIVSPLQLYESGLTLRLVDIGPGRELESERVDDDERDF